MTKSFYLSIPIIFLFLIGCSHTYEVSKYYSKEDLRKEFNRTAPSKELEVVLTNDSSFNVFKGVIVNDTMYLNYNFINTIKTIPISTVNEVTYKNHWKGIIPGFLIGTFTGGAIGATVGHTKHRMEAVAGSSILGLIVGTIVGVIIGFDYIFVFNP